MKAKFYICNHCGNLVTTIHNAGVPLVCCGEKMKELVPNTVEASGEKHLPVAELSGSRLTVTVGAVEHPMADVHYIQWIFVETENGGQIRYLNPGRAPNAVFELGSEKPVAVYASSPVRRYHRRVQCYADPAEGAGGRGQRDHHPVRP